MNRIPQPPHNEIALFPLGQCLATPGALAALEESHELPATFLRRHVTGDWGLVDDEDKAANLVALWEGTRKLSAYETATGCRLWIITDAEGSETTTTLLLPEEY